jgi:hypothetical protein
LAGHGYLLGETFSNVGAGKLDGKIEGGGQAPPLTQCETFLLRWERKLPEKYRFALVNACPVCNIESQIAEDSG